MRELILVPSIFFYRRRLNRLLFTVFVFATLLLSGCAKEDESINYLPTGDVLSVAYSDTSTIVSYTVLEDSIIVYSQDMAANASTFLAGNYMDPVFGYSSASIYAQVGLSSTNVNFGSNLQLDSVILSMDYAGFYGTDTSSEYTVSVFELAEDLYADSTYYSNNNHAYENIPLGTKTFMPDFDNDVILANGDTLPPQIRIRLNDSFGQRLLDRSGQSELVDDESFINYLKGIHVSFSNIATTSGQGLIFYFNLLSSHSKITLYYSNLDDDSLSYGFPFASTHVIHSSFSHIYSGAEIETALSDTAIGSNRIYIQAMGGTKAAITFPFIADWQSKNAVSINKAELILSLDSGTYDELLPNAQLQLLIDSSGNFISTPDESFTSGYAFDGTYNATDNTYTFNISLYIQDVLAGNISANYPLYLMASNAYENAYRSVLGGYDNPTSGMKLKLTYTKL